MKILYFKKILIAAFISVLAIGCTNEFDYGQLQNAVKTTGFVDVTQTTAEVSGIVVTDNGSSISARGICYATQPYPTIQGLKKVANTANLGSYECVIAGLSPSTIYYARAYATNSYGTAYGEAINFKTLAATVPIITSTSTPNLITGTTVKSGGTIINSGASPVTSRGVCYSNNTTTPTIANTKTSDGTGIGTFISTINGLTPNTIYHIRAYATNSVGTSYGEVKSFTTSVATIPQNISTTAVGNILQSTAMSGGTIGADGGATIIGRGVCWSNTTTNPTVANSKTNDGTGVGLFSSSLNNLSSGTTYYVRAYATNSAGTAYGNLKTFTTTNATVATGVTTNSILNITQFNAQSGGNIVGDGGISVTSRGVCWSSNTSNPTISNTKTIDGNGVGSFSSILTSLLPGTTYYVRAYATNGAGTSYGLAKVFTTTSATVPQGISTNSPSDILQTTATSGGNISSDGGALITSRGVCWSNSNSSPTIANNKTINGSGSGSFTSSLTSLIQGTTYYVRAYATNAKGTAYGNTVSLTTTSALYVGQSYQGGKIAYIFAPGDNGYISGQTHGLIVTTSNQSNGSPWGCSGTFINGTSTNLGSGSANTISIVNGCGSLNTAARICYNLSSGGYTDWYLPSRDELSRLYANRIAIGGFSSASYWSSSQVNSTNSWTFNFSTGGTGNSTSKSNSSMFVRAIRKF